MREYLDIWIAGVGKRVSVVGLETFEDLSV